MAQRRLLEMRLVSVKLLEQNMILAKDIIFNEVLVLKEGTKNINKYSHKLSKMGIHYIYVKDTIGEDIKVPDAISDTTRELCKKTLAKTMRSLVNHEEKAMDGLNSSIEQIIDDITNHNIKPSLADIRTIDEYTFSHCTSAAVYALLIGKELNYTKTMLEQLAIGMMLHDIGKIMLDSKILYKKEKLNPKELKYIRQHAKKGFEYIKDRKDITEESKRIVLYHHERLDGSGYPRGLSGDELDQNLRIAGIADVYDALTTDRSYRRRWKPNKAVRYLLENSDILFDCEIVRVLMKNIAIYPNGSTVRLSDGRIALVKEQNMSMPLRPVIKVFSDPWHRIIPIEEIDLMKVLSLTIVDSELEVREHTSSICIDI